ncbi:helix-turn-helix transcriptional regulator [Maribrevibacterium harenarium]|uniref:Helix-turn-helix transcriptional regulator n=1 Tax=Maribrevibacterium harenarium TaxID=2589817 RepID=A0A501WLD5_9GAMM|nr:helix-turn-helix transcriptional regulator [Maribrevibacterium harenarium]TPE46476.1 helix-turn-helix transcriptional regulator [Maribrevibacterium harenarium]
MLRFRLKELIAEKTFKEGKRVTINQVANETGINRATLSSMINQRGYSTVTKNLDVLCRYFGCELSHLAEYVPDEECSV